MNKLLNPEFKHLILRFNKISLFCGYHDAIHGKKNEKIQVVGCGIKLGTFGGATTANPTIHLLFIHVMRNFRL
jgi:hypothetical protein